MNVNSVLLKLPRRFQTPVKLIWQYILLWFSGWYQKWKKKRLLFWTTILNFWIFKCLVHCANFESENWTSENHFYFCSWIRKLHSGKFCTILGKPHTDRRYRKVFCTESISSHHLSYFFIFKKWSRKSWSFSCTFMGMHESIRDGAFKIEWPITKYQYGNFLLHISSESNYWKSHLFHCFSGRFPEIEFY